MTAPVSPAPTTAPTQPASVTAAETARAELYDTLTQLRARLDYAQRIDDRVSEIRRRAAQQRQERPAAFIAGVAGAAVIAGLAVWSVARTVIRTRD